MSVDTTIPRLFVPGLDLQQLPFGLLSAAAEFPREDPHAQLGVQYETLVGVTGGAVDLTPGVPGSFAGTLTPETFAASVQPGSLPTVFTNPFLIYAATQANPVGHTPEEIQARASAKLALNAGRWIEKGLYRGASGGSGLQTSATVLAGTAAAPTAVSINVGIGLLEQWIADNVGAVGLLHASRLFSGSLWNQVHASGAKMLTTLGTPVAFGAGYDGTGPTGAPAPGQSATWLYATGPVMVNRSEPNLRTVPAAQKTSFANQVPLTTAYATEIVSVGIGSGVAAVLVTL